MEIHGTSRADLNGKFGIVTGFHPGYINDPAFPARYTVILNGGKVLKFKQANVYKVALHTFALHTFAGGGLKAP